MDILSAGQALGTLAIGAVMLYQWLETRKKRINKPDLADMDYQDLFEDDLIEIRESFEAMRVSYWTFTNGTVTADNYSNKNLNMVACADRDGVYSLLGQMKNVPSYVFKRNLRALKNSESGVIVSHEHKLNDTLAKFHQDYGLNSNVYAKVYNGKSWTGIIGINLEDKDVQFPDTRLAWLAFKAGQMGVKLKQFKR